MALLFDQIGVRRVSLEVLMWPGFSHGFKEGELSSLYGRLNTDDLFESCELRATVGAEFESEHWTFDINTTRIRVVTEAFQSFAEASKRMLHLLAETQAFFEPRRRPLLYTDRVSVRAVIPDDADREVGDVVRTKLLTRRLNKEDDGGAKPLDFLPGNHTGTGIELVGDTDAYHWHANIGPAHALPSLTIGADLYFAPPSDPPVVGMIAESLETAYSFTKDSVAEFAQRILD